MIMVTYDDSAERDLIVDKSLRDGNYPIVSSVGVMVVGDKDLAIALFRKIAGDYATATGEDAQLVFQCTDDSDRHCIAINPTHPSNVFLYGVTGEEFTAAAPPEERLQ